MNHAIIQNLKTHLKNLLKEIIIISINLVLIKNLQKIPSRVISANNLNFSYW